MSTPYFLSYFELDTSATERDIKRAYARKLKSFDAQLDAEQFDKLRQTYQQALGWADMVVNNPELAKLIWGSEAMPSATPLAADPSEQSQPNEAAGIAKTLEAAQTAQPDVAVAHMGDIRDADDADDATAKPAPAPSELATGFDLPADAPWSASAEWDSLLTGLHVALDPLKYPLPSECYAQFVQHLAQVIERLSNADGGLEKSETFELVCLRSATDDKIKQQFPHIKISRLLPLLETAFGWDETSISNRARELDGWAAQRFYALKHEHFFIQNIDKFIENPRADLLAIVRTDKIPTGKALYKWQAAASDPADLQKIQQLLDAFEQHTTRDNKFIQPSVKQFWREVNPAHFTAQEKRLAYFYNHQTSVLTVVVASVFVWGLNLLSQQFFREPSLDTFVNGTVSFFGLVLSLALLAVTVYALYLAYQKSGIAKSSAWLWVKHAPSPIRWFCLWAIIFFIAKCVK